MSAVPVSLVFLILLFELGHRLLFFCARSDGFEAYRLSGWIDPVALRAELLVTADQGDVDTEWSHGSVLRILLEILAKSLSEHWERRLVLELHFEVSSLLSQPSDDISCIIHVSDNDSTDAFANRKDVCH